MCINDSSQSKQNGRWTKEQHQKFIYAIQLHGKDWKKVQEVIETRTSSQIRSHAQKFFLRLQKGMVLEQPSQNIQLESAVKELQQTLVNQSEPKSILENEKQLSFYMKRIVRVIQESQNQGKDLNFWNSCIEGFKSQIIKKEQNDEQRQDIQQFNLIQHCESVNIFKRNSQSCFSQMGKLCTKKTKLQ